MAENEHGAYWIPRSAAHRPAAKTLLRSAVWEPRTIEFLAGAERGGDLIHAGAFFGDFIPALARSRKAGAIVWAFEPVYESYRCALLTMAVNGLGNVVLLRACLGERLGTKTLATHDRQGVSLGGASHVVADADRDKAGASERVIQMALDDVIDERRPVAAIHLDVERHEREAVAGAMRMIERWRPQLVLELPVSWSWIESTLAPFGYRAVGRVDANLVLACESREAR